MNGFALKRLGAESLVIAVVCAVGIVFFGLNWRTRADSFTIGHVVSFGLVEQKVYSDANSILRAQVKMPNNSEVSVSLPNGLMCPVGSQIQVAEVHTLFGSVFKVGLRGCSSDFRDVGPKPAVP